jgi:hypothetical protein
MKVTSMPASAIAMAPTLERLLTNSRTPKPKSPCAVFTPVPAARQDKVINSLRSTLTRSLSDIAPGRKAEVTELLTHLGQPDFYNVLAKLDPQSASSWNEMARTQQKFGAAEPGYDDTTRAYSESMRLTLHASVIAHFAQPESIALHSTAFHQNGGWVDNLHIPLTGALAVVHAMPVAMWAHLACVGLGSTKADALTVAAAQQVRDARRSAVSGWGP